MNLYHFLMEHVDATKIAIQSRSEEKTYKDIDDMAKAVCFYLADHKIQRGDRIAILAHNSSFWVASYLAILRYGAVAVPVPIDQHETTIHHFLQITGCSICFIDDDHLKKFPDLPVMHIITPDKLESRGTDLAAVPTHHPTEDDLAALMFTSGSTGVPNAVKVSHKNIITNTKSIVEYLQLKSDDRIMVVLPFYYCFGTSLLHTHFRVGGTLVINNQFLYTEDVLNDIENFECTGFAGVPSVYQRLVKRSSFQEREFRHLRHFQQAGGRLGQPIIQTIVEAFPQKKFYVMYGQTEATSRLSYLDPELVLEKINSIGRAIPYVTIEVLNEDNQPVQAGEQGEIVCSGDSITSGYWQDQANQRYIGGKLHTGDIATVDEDGYLYIVGRKSDFLKPGGHRIGSHKIIDVLLLHPDILEAEVIGVYDDELGELVRAFVGVGDNTLSEKDIKRHCLNHLPRFAVPHEIVILKELPKNHAGKVQKTMLLNYE
ncbi:AMP-binding protein [bacterium]|nr:AMP-binding protein [bacterium]